MLVTAAIMLAPVKSISLTPERMPVLASAASAPVPLASGGGGGGDPQRHAAAARGGVAGVVGAGRAGHRGAGPGLAVIDRCLHGHLGDRLRRGELQAA